MFVPFIDGTVRRMIGPTALLRAEQAAGGGFFVDGTNDASNLAFVAVCGKLANRKIHRL